MTAERRIVYCHCAHARIIPAETKQEVLRKLAESGLPFEAVPDLCEMSAARDPRLGQWAAEPSLTISACFPRAVRWLFSAANAPLPADGAVVLNMREEPAEQIVQLILEAHQ